MNKTVNINLGGFFFHIDEDAYQKLNNYFQAIKRSLSPEGRDEIIKDIESRIAELFTQKLKNEKQVVGITEVDEVISVMGQPEDYRVDTEGATIEQPFSQGNYNYNPVRKLYRDKESGTFGGVMAGLGHYFNTDPLWLRIIIVLLVFLGFGTGVLIYLLLWILIPRATTTAEKLAMKGEPVNISNIEKKIKEEFSDVQERLKNVDYQGFADKTKAGAERVGNSLGDLLTTVFKVFARVFGAFLLFVSSISLIGLLVGIVISLFTASVVDFPWMSYADLGNHSDVPLWIILILTLVVAGIPLFFLAYLGLKILTQNTRSLDGYVKYTLFAIWLVAIVLMVYLGVKQATEMGYDGKSSQKEMLNITTKDTLFIKFKFNDFYEKSLDYNHNFKITEDENQKEIIYSNSIRLQYIKTDASQPYILIEKVAQGKSIADARNRAEKINYTYKIDKNTVVFDNYFTTGIENKFRNQVVKIYVYLPENMIIKPDNSVDSYANYNNLYVPYDENNRSYILKSDELECLDCPNTETDWEDESEKIETEAKILEAKAEVLEAEAKLKEAEAQK